MLPFSHRVFPVRPIAGAALLAMALALSGCGRMPVAGPLAPAISNEAMNVAPPFLLVPVNRVTLTALAHVAPDSLSPLAGAAPVPTEMIHVGDKVSVTLWEFGSGLLGPVTDATAAQPGLTGAQSATIPTQKVDQSGNIIIPFAGEIHAAGHNTRQVGAAIIAALRGKANQAQALVQIVDTTENAVTVSGDVKNPGRFPLIPSGTHLLDAVSLAGGTIAPARDMQVQLTRGGIVRSARLVEIQQHPNENIFLMPNDLVTLDHEPETYVVLGATTKNLEVPFTKSSVTLAEAIGDGGGLADQQADPYGVYVLRYETRDLAKLLRTEPLPDYMAANEMVPVVYQINLKTANGMLLAQSFKMRDRDLVYVADSPSVQLSKLAKLFDLVASVFKSGNSTTVAY
jgi:polysaccharide export outer membrane protein